MSSVTNLNEYKGQRKATISGLDRLAADVFTDLRRHQGACTNQPTGNERMLEELEALSSEHMVKRLELAHRRQAFERQQGAEMAELNNELEHAAYFAFMAGVPEDSIYDLNDEYLSEALTRAIQAVQARA